MSEAPDRIAWLVFGDDWGRHPSTTQHLVAHLPACDDVVWVDSLGMRAPHFSARDLARIAGRLRPAAAVGAGDPVGRAPDRRVRPRVLPWHGSRAAVALNRALLDRALADARGRVVLAANPVAALYLDALTPTRVLYLRLDRYADLPGVDAELVGAVEPLMLARADVVLGPSARVLDGVPSSKAVLLPQGVDLARFAPVPLEPPRTRVCGYWGWLGEWLDRDLVRAVARAHPDWTFELRGPRRIPDADLRLGPNVVALPPVPHAALAAHAAHWRAAWAPMTVTHHMAHASPLKLREYLAAGLPTASTPLPEAGDLPLVIVRSPADVAAFLADALEDTPARRAERRRALSSQTWTARAALLREHAPLTTASTRGRPGVVPALTITICTADRPAELADLLDAIAAARPATWERDVVVADNGRSPETAVVVASRSRADLPMRRVAAPPFNIARARNAALAAATGELVLWLDDDQLVDPTFFEDLERAWRHRPAWSDGLRLPFAPRFEAPVSDLVRAWFTPSAMREGAPADRRTFSTNGLLAPRAASLAVPAPGPEGPFDPWFGTRGGEDTDFFLRASAAGLRFSTTRLARVIERVPPARANLRYMARAAFRIGFTDTTLSRRTRGAPTLLVEAGLRAAADVALAPLALGDMDALRLRALSLCRQAGKLWALAGRDYEHYRAR